MSDLLKNIDTGTMLAGTGKLEILMFTLGTDNRTGREETFGINAFRVREVMRIPALTRIPEMPLSVEGMVSLRGVLVPVTDLAKFIGIETDCKPETMIITEYDGQMQGFLVRSVDNILHLDRSATREPPAMLQAEMGGLVTAVTEVSDGARGRVAPGIKTTRAPASRDPEKWRSCCSGWATTKNSASTCSRSRRYARPGI